MNCFSTFSGMRDITNINSFSYINKFTNPLALDFSGTNFTDLSATTTYYTSAAGLNPNSATGNTTLANVNYNNRRLAVSDLSTSGSFTFYLKHAASESTLPAFNFLNPNMVTLSASYTLVGQSFSARFYSFLNPGSIIPYSISGAQSSDLSGAAVRGFFTAPYQEISYRVTAVPISSVFFNVSGGLGKSHIIPTAIYIVTVSAGSFVCYTSAGVLVPFPLSLNSGSVYIFDQSALTNNGYNFKLSNSAIFTNNEITSVTNGTPGVLNAYMQVSPTSSISGRPLMLYRMTIMNGRTIYLNAISKPTITFVAGNRYIFDQSDSTNAENPIVFSRNTSGEPTLPASDGTVTVVGIPGQTGAYTILDVSGAFTGTLYYLIIVPPLISLRHTRISGITGDTTMTTDPSNNFVMDMDYTGMNVAIIRKSTIYLSSYPGPGWLPVGYSYKSYQGNPVSFEETLNVDNANYLSTLSVDSSFNVMRPYVRPDGGVSFTILTRCSGSVFFDLNGTGFRFTSFGEKPFEGLYGTARIMTNPAGYGAKYSTNFPSNLNNKTLNPGIILQMAATPSFSHVLFAISTNLGEDSSDLNDYTALNSQRSVTFKISTNITTATTPTYRDISRNSINLTSVGNGLVYVSKTGSFMAICTNSSFHYSRDSFVTYTTINTGDLMNNFFKLNFYFNFNTSRWFVYNETNRCGFFLKSDDGGLTSKLYTTSNFISSQIISDLVVRPKSTLPIQIQIPNMTQSLFKSSADADYFLLYGTYDTSPGFYYVSVDYNKEPQPAIIFTVTVSGGVYWISTNSAAPVEKANVTLTPGNTYVFDQSHASNVGYPLRLSITGFSPSYNTRVDISGIPGYLNASTTIEVTASTTLPLYYYSTTVNGMGNVTPQLPFIWYTFVNDFGTTVRNYGAGGASYNATLPINHYSNNLSYAKPILNDLSKNRFGLFGNAVTYGASLALPTVPKTEFTNGASMSLWIYIETVRSSDSMVLSTFDVVSGGQYYFNIFINDGNTFGETGELGPITIKKWIHYVQVFSVNASNQYTKTTYIDNISKQVVTGLTISNINNFGSSLMSQGNNYDDLYGYIADFRFYKKALTVSEITDLYNNT